ncbi:MAG: hypothetical protein CM15mP78_13130 [Candidatus Poseidoniales archaeon]|nr:MAG: hypothetical protein CM15mP78_13130 [Candidatus Poseidoniales archaeon]
MADIRDKFALPVDEDFVLADHPTLNHMIGYIQRMTGGAPAALVPAPAPAAPAPAPPTPAPTPTPAPSVATGSHSDIEDVLVSVVVDHTGYPADFIEMDQDLEGELGIDTVKQAEIMAEIRDRFSLPVDEDFVLADHPTLNHFTAYIVRCVAAKPMRPRRPLRLPSRKPALVRWRPNVRHRIRRGPADGRLKSRTVPVNLRRLTWRDHRRVRRRVGHR